MYSSAHFEQLRHSVLRIELSPPSARRPGIPVTRTNAAHRYSLRYPPLDRRPAVAAAFNVLFRIVANGRLCVGNRINNITRAIVENDASRPEILCVARRGKDAIRQKAAHRYLTPGSDTIRRVNPQYRLLQEAVLDISLRHLSEWYRLASEFRR